MSFKSLFSEPSLTEPYLQSLETKDQEKMMAEKTHAKKLDAT